MTAGNPASSGSSGDQGPPVRTQAAEIVELGRQATTAYDRPDLERRLAAAHFRLTSPEVRVLVVGEFKQGKSTLVNALLNAPICPVDEDVATCVPTLVRHADTPRASVIPQRPTEEEHDGNSSQPPPEPKAIDIELAQVAQYVSEAGNPSNERGIQIVEVGIPRSLLATGLVVIDTPGMGGLGSVHSALTMAVLPTADAVLLVTDASQELTEPELRFLEQATDLCPNTAVVVTKTDLYPEWRKVRDLDQEHLERNGFPVPIVPVSSPLRMRAIESEDPALNAESGFPELIRLVQEGAIAQSDRLAVRSAVNDVVAVVDQIDAQFAAERDALANPERVAELRERLERAQQDATDLQGRAAKWQVTMGDGLSDLNADVDHDLRERVRTLSADAERAIDDGDPAETWGEIQPWFEQRVAEELSRHYTFLARRVDELTERVAEHFGEGETDLIRSIETDAPIGVVEQVSGNDPDLTAGGTLAHALTGLRGSYGGFLMFGMVGQMIGLAALNPGVLAIGFFMGRKALRDEKQRQLTQRRAQAKGAVRKYVDEVSFKVGKDSRDRLREVQRVLRDTFTGRAEELQRSTKDALAAVQSAIQTEDSERQTRIRDLEAEMERLGALRRQAVALAPTMDRRSR